MYPIVVINWGNPRHLPICLMQARITNPNADIILLGDKTNHYSFVKHHLLGDYSKRATELSKVYCHLSSNIYDFELWCIQRWFILHEFMKANGIEKCYQADSDVMLYADINVLADDYQDCAFTIQKSSSSQYSVCPPAYINSIDALERFCDYIFDFYTKPESLCKLKEFYSDNFLASQRNGGVCDMTFWYYYYQEHPEYFLDTYSFMTGNSMLDHYVGDPQGFDMDPEKQMKKILMKKNAPWSYNREMKMLVRFDSLHFQGNSKHYLKQYFTGGKCRLAFCMTYYYWRKIMQVAKSHSHSR